MARENRMQTGTQNPAKRFFTWKSEHQKFCYYDKEEKKNIFVDMPFRFLAIVNYKTITGYNSKRDSGIYSNEVRSLKETLNVKFFRENENLASGLWNDIKEAVESYNGKYAESVYAMLPNGELVNIKIYGASLSTWFEFQKGQQDRFFNQWVVVNGFKEGRQGSVNYTYPVFEWGENLDTEALVMAENADDHIKQYQLDYFGPEVKEEPRANSAVNAYEEKQEKVDAEMQMHEELTSEEDDLPF